MIAPDNRPRTLRRATIWGNPLSRNSENPRLFFRGKPHWVHTTASVETLAPHSSHAMSAITFSWSQRQVSRCMWVRSLCASPGPTARQGSLYLIENDAGSAEARFTDLGTEAVGPNLLRGLYRAENLASLGGEPQEFRPAVARIVLVDC